MQASGKIKTGTSAIVDGQYLGIGFSFPATINLTSIAAGRKIELSTDGGKSYFAPELDSSTTESISCRLFAPVSNIKFTGALNDVWSVL